MEANLIMPTAKKRCYEYLSMRYDGATLQEIANHFGVSKERVRQQIGKAERFLRIKADTKEVMPAEWHDGLSVRTWNSLKNAGYTDLETICAALIDGSLNLKNVYAMGKKSIKEFYDWLQKKEATTPNQMEIILRIEKSGIKKRH